MASKLTRKSKVTGLNSRFRQTFSLEILTIAYLHVCVFILLVYSTQVEIKNLEAQLYSHYMSYPAQSTGLCR